MLHEASLPTETRRLFDDLANNPLIHDFVLIGGTALSLFLNHRQSEDLDFAYVGLKLPRQQCREIIDYLAGLGWLITDVSDDLTRLYQENEGCDLADLQQDWLCRHPSGEMGVKLTFFAEYHDHKQAVCRGENAAKGHIRILTPDGLFKLKSQLLMLRTTLRDLFDLWSLLERGRRVEDILEEARAQDPYITYERLRSRLLPARVPGTDPGLSALVQDGPDTLEALKLALLPHLDGYEQRLAAKMLLEDGAD